MVPVGAFSTCDLSSRLQLSSSSSSLVQPPLLTPAPLPGPPTGLPPPESTLPRCLSQRGCLRTQVRSRHVSSCSKTPRLTLFSKEPNLWCPGPRPPNPPPHRGARGIPNPSHLPAPPTPCTAVQPWPGSPSLLPREPPRTSIWATCPGLSHVQCLTPLCAQMFHI